MKITAIEKIQSEIKEKIDRVREVGSITSITIAFPVDFKPTSNEYGLLSAITSSHLKRFMSRRQWSSVKVSVRSRMRSAQRYIEVVITDGFAPPRPTPAPVE